MNSNPNWEVPPCGISTQSFAPCIYQLTTIQFIQLSSKQFQYAQYSFFSFLSFLLSRFPYGDFCSFRRSLHLQPYRPAGSDPVLSVSPLSIAHTKGLSIQEGQGLLQSRNQVEEAISTVPAEPVPEAEQHPVQARP